MENMVNNPIISVLIPTYNRAQELEKALVSVFKNEFSNLEIIVYDNNSNDNTKEVIEKFQDQYPYLKYYCQSENVGPLENWKSSLNVASGKFIHWLWSDDWVENCFYKKMYEKVEKESADIVFCSIKTTNFEGNWEKITFNNGNRSYNSMDFLKKYLKGFKYPLSPAACILKAKYCKEILNNFIVLDTKNINVNKYGTGYDALMILENIYNSQKIVFINDQLINFRFHKNSISVAESGSGNQSRYALSRLVWAKNKGISLWYGRYDLLRLLFYKKYYELYHLKKILNNG